MVHNPVPREVLTDVRHFQALALVDLLRHRHTKLEYVHLLGNFLLTSMRTAPRYPWHGEEYAMQIAREELVIAGLPADHAGELAGLIPDRHIQRLVFSLSHIPRDSPELHVTNRGRDIGLDESEFCRQAFMRVYGDPEQLGLIHPLVEKKVS